MLRLAATPQNIKYALRLRGEIINAIERGKFNYAEYFPNSKRAKIFGHAVGGNKITIGELLEDVLKDAKATLEYSTYLGYKRVCNAHLFPKVGHYYASEFKSSHIKEMIKGIGRTLKTTRNILIPLRIALDNALNDEKIESNPFEKIVVKKLVGKAVSKSNYKADPFTLQEIKAILSVAEGQEKNFYQYNFFSGLRCPSEMIGLEWSTVFFDKGEGVVEVITTIVERQKKDRTKTVAGTREVVMLPQAREALLNQFEYTGKAGGKVFHHPYTNQPWADPQQVRERWIRTLEKADVRYRNPYQMRHTFASMMLSRGENIMWVAKMLGHINIQMVIKIYGKWIPDATGYKPVNDWGKILL